MEQQTDGFDDFFGQAKQGGGDGFLWKMFQLSETEANVFRIAPPVKSLKTSGRWSVYDSLHYGYTVPNPDAPDKPRHKPFRCIFRKNRATGMIEQDCPECNLLEQKENELKALEAAQIASGKTPDEAAEFVKGARRVMKSHNLDKKHYVLAKNLAGEWGVLKLPHRAKQALDAVYDKYTKDNKGESPLAHNGGVWFEFTRKGKGLQTEYHVAIAQESLGGGRFQYKSGVLTAADIDGIKKCPDLATVNDNKVLSYDQILALVRSGGDPTIAQQVFGQGSRQSRPAATEQAPAPTQVQAPVPAPAPVQAPAAQDQAALIAALQAQLAALQTPKPAETPAPALVPEPAVKKSQDMAPEFKAPASTPAPAPTQSAATQSFNDLMKLDPKQFLATFSDPNKK